MRTTAVAGAVIGLTLLTAAPALAAPQVSLRSCELDGGILTRVQGTKTCTLRTTSIHYDIPVRHPAAGVEVQSADEVWRYIGVTSYATLSETTTTWTQKGNGRVTVTGPTTVVLDQYLHPYDCLVEIYESGVLEDTASVALSDCQSRGLFPG